MRSKEVWVGVQRDGGWIRGLVEKWDMWIVKRGIRGGRSLFICSGCDVFGCTRFSCFCGFLWFSCFSFNSTENIEFIEVRSNNNYSFELDLGNILL